MYASDLAANLLQSAFAEVNNMPAQWANSVGWSGPSKQRVIEKAGTLRETADDVVRLTSIIESKVLVNPGCTVMDVIAANSVCDFLTNCVAEKITSPCLEVSY